MKRLAWTVPACMVLAQASAAEVRLGQEAALHFASVEEGRGILSTRDEFIRHMSPFDRALRLKRNENVSEPEYLELAAGTVRPWTDADKQAVGSALGGIQSELQSYASLLPEEMALIKVSGQAEGNSAYTRSNAIVLPESMIDDPPYMLQLLLAHELFHVMSRENSDLRDRLYNLIGFRRCHGFEFPPELESTRITNPDAPVNRHCIRLEVAGSDRWAVPVLLSNRSEYDMARGGAVFDYLKFRFLLVDLDEASAVTVRREDGEPVVVAPGAVSGYFEQVGRNTQYIIHPEEILADNFAYLVLGIEGMESPGIIEQLQRVLHSAVSSAN